MIRRYFPDAKIRRSWMLLRVLHGLAGFTVAVIGYAYSPITPSPDELPAGLVIITEIIPLWVWGLPWAFAGAMCIASSIMDLRPPWLARSAGITVAICLVWSLAYLAGWLIVGGRGWVSAAIYMFGALMCFAFAEALAILRRVLEVAR